jgi:hypothetical protein
LTTNDFHIALCTRTYLGFYHFAAAQAGRAHTNALGRAANFRAHGAQVYVPASFADIVRVADIVPELRPLPANITYLCHWTALSRRFRISWVKLRFYKSMCTFAKWCAVFRRQGVNVNGMTKAQGFYADL